MRLFITEKIKALVFIIFAIFSFISLVSFSTNDPGINFVGNNNEITNMMGLFGAYFASILYAFLGYSSYLIPIFFITHGFIALVRNKKGNASIKLMILLFGIIFLNYSVYILDNNFSLLSIFLNNVSGSYLEEIFYSKFFNQLISIFLGLISIFFIMYSINISLKYFSRFGKFFYNIIIIVMLPIKLILLQFRKFKIKKPINNLTIHTKNNQRKVEPTILRGFKNKKVFSKEHISQKTFNESSYVLPNISLLKKSIQKKLSSRELEKVNLDLSKKLESTLEEYGVEGQIVNYKSGPVVTLFEFIPAAGVKTSKIVGLSEDIARAMSSISTRIAAQPGKTSVGIEIPNQKREAVLLGDLIDDEYFKNSEEGLILALGKNISGEKKFTNLEKMPHLLIAGTTGSGKSVGINSMIISLLYKFTPSECKLILIDPKMLELSVYEDIPHLLTPVVTNPNKAVYALKWVVREMENRYRLMSSLNVKNINSFNQKIIKAISGGRKLYREAQTGIDKETRKPIIEKKEISLEKMPLIVVIIDEMADLMMVAGKEVENLVQRLAQMARASGIHIIAATQRPSVDVITGTIKANFPSRISFRVASRFDSRTILNEMGAEQLLGSGDMLFIENGASLNRVHGGFVSENEIESVVEHIKSQKTNEAQEDIAIENYENDKQVGMELEFTNKNVDELYEKAVSLVIDQQKVSTSFVQRYLQIGYNRAARMIEKMEEDGIISEPSNAGKRNVLTKNK
ncbi:DNA translocase FtsK 4TM domain-containing protein [Alphaproteobacteria bacterium]|nr:DNA translocase FtsK 4TM domain-containing protein [Alphaproteobacteria bacterium]